MVRARLLQLDSLVTFPYLQHPLIARSPFKNDNLNQK